MTSALERCPCGDIHELSAAVRAAYGQVITLAGNPTVVVETPDGRWRVPRIYIACHGLKAADLPALARRYRFEPVNPV